MADGDKKKINPYDVFYQVILFILVVFIVFIAYCKITNTYLFLFDRLFSCYTMGFFAALLILLMRLSLHLRKNQKKFDLQAWYIIISSAAALVCFFTNMVSDMNDSKKKAVLTIGDEKSVILCEAEDENAYQTERRIIVYSAGTRLARKRGWIDETYFGCKCIEGNSYKYYVSEDGRRLTLECFYVTYGDENNIFTLVPDKNVGSLRYEFEIK